LQVFEKARAYKARNKSENVLPVVLLDEVGLAEVSHHNPLKVRFRAPCVDVLNNKEGVRPQRRMALTG
jgi:hypothetical protein